MAPRGRREAKEDSETKEVTPPSLRPGSGQAEPLTYAAAGVDISTKTDLLERLKPLFRSTFSSQVAGDVGAFGGFFSARDLGCEDPVLVASTDSVGTKVRVAVLAGKHKSIGWDIVAHCANDIVCQGARPLFFLDYFATAKLEPRIMEEVVEGLAECCRQAECPLIGGETAELPGFYQPGDYDLVGFIVGVVDKKARITGESICPGDVLLGLASDGLHTNGYSLARKLFFEIQGMAVDTPVPELDSTIGEALLRPHRLYAPALLQLMREFDVRGIAHITGGGLPDNLPRCLPEGCRAVVKRASWSLPAVFQLIQRLGNVADEEMFHTFNMGIGAVVIVPPEQAEDAAQRLRSLGETPLSIGKVETGERGVTILS
ncbi:MAG: phosphoribosylformylglycinamidine cyclo-ligase [Armatimonadetes bacterium]|nr:phosphoribosylformylglycinamidine cyclo-ligase [Armatimonadota bacterium]NIM24247.1 phosphoribosylformylglycinamidine cyclo-ligase [Armatimonadota bacterium]NIM68116.1 phosphoribosylformylglycinamidine cyclo-ligase [Armatimonadota bacterium]NIM76578.1 phosphoribosylformylglycinamidine cyclo-ligase [Armatimonadota bacterium]NIN06321.1 phosphoribosylformylglycinamidine cyclo-ligase [Armatimonadota bacterium]